ncbi:MAG: GNAT family protein [Propionicimonas sp.]|nr:GNAT family protein [Propionicimonas sp.]
MPLLPDGRVLSGRFVRLAPVTADDLPPLAAILADPAVYRAGWRMTRRPDPGDDALAAARRQYLGVPAPDGEGRGRIVYAVQLVGASGLGPAGTVVGTTSLGDVMVAHGRLHLGWTLYHREVWGTAVNPETKYLLLRHCFDDLGFTRVKIQTDALNTRSAAAIARLGAQREGVLRRHQRREDGSYRDTVVFSVIDTDWPAVRGGLEARLAGSGPVG